MTDLNRIAAIAVSVYRELIPKMYTRIRKLMGMPKPVIEYDAYLANLEYTNWYQKLYEQMLQMGKEKHPMILLL